MLLKRFNEVVSNIKKFNLDNYSKDNILKLIQEKTNYCKEIEQNSIRKIYVIIIIDLFQVPEGLVAFTCTLVDKVNDNKAQIQNTEQIKYNNIEHREKIT